MYEYNNEQQNEKLQHWLMTHQPSDNMLYKEAWWKYLTFIRSDIIEDMFYWPMVCNLRGDFEKQKRLMSENYEIVGTHWSKSIEHPVILMRYKGAEIVFRYNFYDYEITVISDKELEFPDALFDKKKKTFYYQGFPEKYQIKTSYAESKKRFSVELSPQCQYKFYTFMFLLKAQLDEKNKK
jgi:hypothetical protein